MIVKVGNCSGSQFKGDEVVKIYENDKLIKELPARKDLSYDELVKIVELYTGGRK